MEHDGCKLCKYEKCSMESKECMGCKQNAVDKYKRMTQADRIRSMSDEELAKFIHEPFCDNRTHEECTFSYCGDCYQCSLDWLRQPAEGGQK